MKIVFVDDDDHIRWLTQTVVESLGHCVVPFSGAEEALAFLTCNPGECDCLLLDRNMPGMDGMGMLKAIRANPELEELPVVILTSSSEPEEVAEGLAAGAQLYLAKPAPKKLLKAALSQIQTSLQERKDVQEHLRETRRGLALASYLEFDIRTLPQARQLSGLLASLTPDPDKTSIGFAELLINGIEHGNLAISYAEKSALLEENDLNTEIERRLGLPEYASRKVMVRVWNKANGIQVEIEDEGDGFDWQPFMDFSPERAFDLHGRGIAISNKMAFDRLNYIGKGNKVQVEVSRTDLKATEIPALKELAV